MRREWSSSFVFGLVLVACSGGGDDAYPIVPGGDDTPIHPMSDAAVPDVADAPPGTISGRVCLVTDLRDLTLPACSGTNAGGLTVSLGTEVSTTAPDGSFTIMSVTGTDLVWRVDGPGVVPSVLRFGTVHVLPVVSGVTFDDLLLSNGVILQPDQGSIVLRVLRQGQPLAGVEAITIPPAGYATYYDGPTATVWHQDSTGPLGAIWIPGAPTGSVTVRLTPGTGSAADVVVPVETLAITFATLAIP